MTTPTAGYQLSTNDEARLRLVHSLEQVAKAATSFESVANGIKDTDDTFYTKPKDKTFADMVEIATAAAVEEQTIITVSNTFEYRIWDGAHATAKVIFDTWGYPGFGQTIPATMFSPEQPPERRKINVGPGKKIEVPWGWLSIPDLHAVVKLGFVRDREKGTLFHLDTSCPKLMEKAVSGLYTMIEEELKKHSLYRGKAITGAEDPDFLDLSKVNPRDVIFSHGVQEALEHELWFPIEHYRVMQADKQPTRWVTLLDGAYGTGKTLASILTAQRCVQENITFIQIRPGEDDLKQVMQTAMLYAPCVVAFEDVDVVADPAKTSEQEISRLLEAFDGVRSKGADVQVILTTNHSDKIHAGMLRAGRLHTYIKFGDLDATALYQLIKIKVGDARMDNVDKDAVHEACQGYEPAFMDLVIQVARRYASSRRFKTLIKTMSKTQAEDQAVNYKIGTADFVSAAERLRPQWQLMKDATTPKQRDRFEESLQEAVQTAITKLTIVDSDGDYMYGIKGDQKAIEA